MMPLSRPLIRVALALPLAAAAVSPAEAACGDSYTIASGDTLGAIAKRCDVTVAAIRAANPDMGSPRSLQIGQVLRMPGAAGTAGPARAKAPVDVGPEGYEVRDGDTLYTIAARLDVPVARLLRENPDLDPGALEPGTRIAVPEEAGGVDEADRPVARASISPAYGDAGSAVTVRAGGLEPGETVAVRAGMAGGRWETLADVDADGEGGLVASVTVPESFGLGDDLVFVLRRASGETLPAGGFDVVNAAPPGEDAADPEIVLIGRLGDGVECPTLTTDGGEVYALLGVPADRTGEGRVEVRGQPVDASFCMQDPTLEVIALRPAQR